jgi:hypothetical protein
MAQYARPSWQELSDGIKALSKDSSSSQSSGHNVAYFDIPQYWFYIRSHPETVRLPPSLFLALKHGYLLQLC